MSEEDISAFRKSILIVISIICSFVLTIVISLIGSIVFSGSANLPVASSIITLTFFVWPFFIYPYLRKQDLIAKGEKEKVEPQAVPKISPEQRKIYELESRISAQEEEISKFQKRYSMANKDIANLKALNEELKDKGNSDTRFSQVKRAFAQKYHPDNIHSNGIEKLVKEEIFKDFWEDISRIEKDD